MKIGDRIRRARGARGMTRRELAQASGIPYPTLAGIENGDQGSSTRLHVLARALRVRVEWLESGKGAMDAPEPAAVPDSQDVRLDPTIIAETHRTLRELEEGEGRTFSLEDEVYAAWFMQTYQMRAAMPAHPTVEEWVQFENKLQAITGGEQGDGRSDGVPTQGTGKGKVAGTVRR